MAVTEDRSAEARDVAVRLVSSFGNPDAIAPLLAAPQGPILLDCLIDPEVQAPFVTEMSEAERRQSGR